MLANPGFEDGTSGWLSLDASLQASETARSGSAALAMSSPTFEQAADVFQNLSVNGGWGYRFSAWVVIDNANIDRAFLRISWFDSHYSLLASTDSPWLTGRSAAYRQLDSGSRTAPANAASARVAVFVVSGGPFSALVDDTSFSAVSIPPSIAPTPVPTVTPSSTFAPTPTPVLTPGAGSSPGPVQETPTPAPIDEEPTVFALLTNGGFEIMREDGTAYGWRKVGGEVLVTEEATREGRRALRVSSSTESTKWAYQVVSVVPGRWYRLSAWTRVTGAESFLRISWYASGDGSGRALSTADSLDEVSSTGPAFAVMDTGPVQAPAEAYSAKVRLMVRPGSAAAQSVVFDAVSFGNTGASAIGDDDESVAAGRSSNSLTRVLTVEGRLSGSGPETEPVPERAALIANVRPVPPDDERGYGGTSSTPGRSLADVALLALIVVPLTLIGLLFARDVLQRGDTA